MKKNSLSSRVIKTEPVDWRTFQFLQDDQFKSLSEEAKSKLRSSLQANKFTQPFYVWQDPKDNVIYCLDGWHRSGMMKELEAEGWTVPKKLPATFIECRDKTEAAKLVLIYSSMYAQITQDGLFGFMEAFELSTPEMFESIHLPEFDVKMFFGDADKDFSLSNQELDLEEFNDEMILKLKYSKTDYLEVKKRLEDLTASSGNTAEQLILKLLIANALPF